MLPVSKEHGFENIINILLLISRQLGQSKAIAYFIHHLHLQPIRDTAEHRPVSAIKICRKHIKFLSNR